MVFKNHSIFNPVFSTTINTSNTKNCFNILSLPIVCKVFKPKYRYSVVHLRDTYECYYKDYKIHISYKRLFTVKSGTKVNTSIVEV